MVVQTGQMVNGFATMMRRRRNEPNKVQYDGSGRGSGRGSGSSSSSSGNGSGSGSGRGVIQLLLS